MNFDRQKGFLWGAEFVCRQCHHVQRRKASHQEFCSKTCWTAYQNAQVTAHKRYQKSQHKQGLAAPALKASCEALESLCTVHNRDYWAQIIAHFVTPHVPGYRDLTWLTKACVGAKLLR